MSRLWGGRVESIVDYAGDKSGNKIPEERLIGIGKELSIRVVVFFFFGLMIDLGLRLSASFLGWGKMQMVITLSEIIPKGFLR